MYKRQGQPENYAEWKEIYSEKGGQYRMTVQYTQGAGRQLELTVNGEKQVLKQLGDDNGLRTVTVPAVSYTHLVRRIKRLNLQ